MRRKGKRYKKNNFCNIWIIILGLFLLSVSFSKYKNNTISAVIQLFAKYKVNYVTAGGIIKNIDKFSSYLSINGLILPSESENDEENYISRKGYDLVGWYENTSFTGEPIIEIKKGDSGDKTYYALWTPSRYTFTANVVYENGEQEIGLPEGWDLVIGKDENGNDRIIELDANGQIIIDKGEIVSLRTQYSSDVTVAGWSIEDIVLTERYQSGDQYIYYDFKMPKHPVIANYGVTTSYLDLSKSPIIFEENVDVGSRTQNGFWYKQTISGMAPLVQDDEKGYFYIWDNSEPLYVTSNGKETQNRLTITNQMTIYLKDCNLVATDTYLESANNRKISGVDVTNTHLGLSEVVSNLNNAVSDLSEYGNIVIDTSEHPSFRVNLYFEGDNNIINSIFSNKIHTETSYKYSIYLYSANSDKVKLKVGSMFGDFSYNVNNVEIQELKKDENDFEYLFYGVRGSVAFNSGSVVVAPSKSIMASFSAGSAKVEIKNITSTTCSLSGNTYLRVRENIYLEYTCFGMSGTASAVIDGSIVHNYQHWSSTGNCSSSGYLIVKGNRYDATSSIISNTKVICNALAVGKSFGATNSTIITNQIINNPEKGWKVENGEYVYTNGSEPTNRNNEDYPFLTYPVASEGNTSYSFDSGNDIYLFGHYKTVDGKYDTNMKATDDDNPVKKYLDILLDEKGDLREISSDGKVIITNENGEEESVLAIDKTLLEQDVKSSENINAECFMIGKSALDKDGNYREININGSNIYAVGNMNFFNDTTVVDGIMYANGNISCKRDFIINGGTIEANQLGNSYNHTSNIDDGILSWSKTIINGGNITANRIGTLSYCEANDNIVPRSATYISSDATIVGNPEVLHDVYVNYVCNENVFNNTNSFNNIQLKRNWNVENALWQIENDIVISPPIVKSNNEGANWNLNSIVGPAINKINLQGIAQYNETDVEAIYDKEYIALYAIKGAYKINIKEGADKYSEITNSNSEKLDLNNVKVNDTIVLKLSDNEYINKCVILYKDDNGKICNVMPEKNENIITFTMPPADVEIYITDNMILNLSETSYTIAENGFIAELEVSREDSYFEYQGDITLEQSELSSVSVSNFSTSSSSKFTKNMIQIASSVDNINSERKITLRKVLQQSAGLFEVGLKLEDGAKVKITLDGPVQLSRIEVPVNSDIILEGKNGNTIDYLGAIASGDGTYNNVALGNYSGEAGNITLRNLSIASYSGRLTGLFCTSSTATSKTVTFDNCAMNFSSWYSSSYIANKMKEVIIKDCKFSITAASTWPAPLFTGIDNVQIQNSEISLLNNSSYSSNGSQPIFYGIKNQLLIDSSTITTSLRVPTNNTIYKTLQAVKDIAPEIKLINDSTFTTDQRVRLKRIVIEDDSVLNVGNEGDGYLLCSDIEVNDSATLNAGYILVSGFYDTKNTTAGNEPITKDSVLAKLSSSSNIMNGANEKGLIINGGTINVNEFVGGDVNGKVIVNNGSLNAKRIGTIGQLFGYGTYVPHQITSNGQTYMEEYVYTLNKIPEKGTTVTVNGGTVNVLDNGYIGGMNATVEVNGGVINLGTNAIVGLIETDKTTLLNDYTSKGLTPSNFVAVNILNGEVKGNSGIINIPYGILNISGTSTGINVKDIIGEKGNVNIANANSKYSNPYVSEHGSAQHQSVGVIVNNSLSAQNIIISEGAIVYSKEAVANAIDSTDEGLLRVSYEEPKSYLYSDIYGSDGKGMVTIDVNGNVLLNRQYSIYYKMNDTYQDRANNPNALNYICGIGVTLEEPTRFGYEFEGWYDENGNEVTIISTTETGNINLEAKWIPKTVEFQISINASDIGLDANEFANEVDLTKGSLNETKNVFTYTDIVEVEYHELLAGDGKIQLLNYDLKSYQVLALKINNETLNPEEEDMNLSLASVTQEIMKYYLENEKPIELLITLIAPK